MKEYFFSYISQQLEQEASLDYKWNNDNTEIQFRKKAEDGFDIEVGCTDSDSIFLKTSTGYHELFESSDDFEELLIGVMGLVRDMLSKRMRIVEKLSKKKSRKWVLQIYIDEQWITEDTVGFLIWNFFGRRSERIYQNDILPVREY